MYHHVDEHLSKNILYMISLHIRQISFFNLPYIVYIPIPACFSHKRKIMLQKKKQTFLFSLHTYYLGHPIGKALFHDYGPPMFLRSPIISKLFNYFSFFFFKHYIYPPPSSYIIISSVFCCQNCEMFLFYFFDHMYTTFKRKQKTTHCC